LGVASLLSLSCRLTSGRHGKHTCGSGWGGRTWSPRGMRMPKAKEARTGCGMGLRCLEGEARAPTCVWTRVNGDAGWGSGV
jgi:hypothetical protein